MREDTIREGLLFLLSAVQPPSTREDMPPNSGIKEIVVPLTASVHGATGLVSSDVVYEYGKSDRLFVPAEIGRINETFSVLVQRAIANLRSAGIKNDDIEIIRSLDMRYRHQVHELNVPLHPGVGEFRRKRWNRRMIASTNSTNKPTDPARATGRPAKK